MNTNFCFEPGKVTTLMDGQFGSSGKGKLGSFITEHADNFQFACNAFSAQAGHWIVLDDGRKYFYQHLNSCGYQDKFERIYIGPASCIELPALLREIEINNLSYENGVKPRLGISPLAAIILTTDFDFEKGFASFDSSKSDNPRDWHHGTADSGSTCHGVGSCTARKVLRRPSVLLARDVPELRPFLCNVSEEILKRLDKGQSGLFEIAQGFPLSLNYMFYPNCTSRSVTVSQGLSDMFLPPRVAGPTVINFRTFPIRINSNKYVGANGQHLTWEDVQNGAEHTVLQGNSGGWYPDQREITWEEVTRLSGSKEKIFEITSVTKLPRRVATFSRENLEEAIKYNQTSSPTYLSVNFANYVDGRVSGVRSLAELTPTVLGWIADNLGDHKDKLRFVGTGARTDDMVLL